MLHKVAETIGKGIIDKELVTPAVVFGALVGAMFWNVVTWVKGIPSSSSHALVGGIVGAGVAHAGMEGIIWTGLNKTLVAIVLSPTLGMVISMLIMLASSWAMKGATARRAESGFKSLHLISSATYSISHGLNDAQKTMGTRITKLSHHQGFAASAGGSIMVFAASLLGIPVSTTHTITGCVIGAGAAKRASAVRWGVARNLLVAWFLTVPASALVAAAFYMLTRLF